MTTKQHKGMKREKPVETSAFAKQQQQLCEDIPAQSADPQP
jgi:hypothetical protein